MAARKKYTEEDLQALSRAKLNIVCVNRGINVSDETPDDDVLRMILAQQDKELATREEAVAEVPQEQPVTETEPEPVSHPDEGVPENPEASAPPKEPPKKASGNDRVWFKVSAGSAAHEKNDVFASLNGESVLIKRNHWVKLPRKFLAVFENAIQTEFELTEDETLFERQVPRFNIQIRTIEQGLPPEKCRPV